MSEVQTLIELETWLETQADRYQPTDREYESGLSEGYTQAARQAYEVRSRIEDDPPEWRCSSLPLALACPASQLPDIRVAGPDDASRMGTAVHACLARILKGEPFAGGHLAKAHGVDPLEAGMLTGWALKVWEHVKHGFPNAAFEEFLMVDRIEWILMGHIDVLSVVGSEVHILDWKTGYVDADHDDQVRGYAYLALHHHLECDRAYVATVRVRDQAVDGVWYTREEIDAWWESAVERLRDRHQYRVGRHCGHCPRGATCPAKASHLAQAAHALIGSYQAMTFPHTPRVIGDVYDRIKLMESAIESARDAVRAEVAARGGRLPLPDGRELVINSQQRRSLDYIPAYPVLIDELTDEEIAAAASLNRAKIDRAIMDRADRGQKKKHLEDVYARLEEAGAINTTIIERLEVKKRGISDSDGTSEQQRIEHVGEPAGASA